MEPRNVSGYKSGFVVAICMRIHKSVRRIHVENYSPSTLRNLWQAVLTMCSFLKVWYFAEQWSICH